MQLFRSDAALHHIQLTRSRGPPEPRRSIFINSQTLYVRDNLWTLLKAIRDQEIPGLEDVLKQAITWKTGQRTYFWCDQIGIDQSNTKERNHQVGMMSRIYKAATETLVWLGPQSMPLDSFHFRSVDEQMRRSDSKVLACFRYHGGMGWTIVDSKRLEVLRPWTWFREEEDDDSEHETTEYPSDPPRDQIELVLTAAIQQAYWSRLWVVQEIWFSRSVQVLYGCHLIPWSSLVAFARPRPRFSGGVAMNMFPALQRCVPQPLTELIVSKQDFTQFSGSQQRLSTILESYGKLSCEDDRDKVFGLLGLVPEDKRVEVDYSLSKEQLFYKVVAKVVADEPLSSHSSHCDFASELQTILGLDEHASPAGLRNSEIELFVHEQRKSTKAVGEIKEPIAQSVNETSSSLHEWIMTKNAGQKASSGDHAIFVSEEDREAMAKWLGLEAQWKREREERLKGRHWHWDARGRWILKEGAA